MTDAGDPSADEDPGPGAATAPRPAEGPGPVPMPDVVEPMKATPSEHLPPDDANWSYEIKWDGFRVIAFVAGGTVRLQSRRLLDCTADFPELRPLAGAVPHDRAVLDGEVVVLDERGRPSFGLLQQRAKHRSPAVYMVFDLLHLDGRSTTGLPYTQRRRLLESLALTGPAWRTPAHHVGDGEALLAASRANGLEGLVAKRLDSVYEPGRRSRSWLKVKHECRQELVVGGWMPGEGGRNGRLGSLLVGYHEGGRLRYAGRVGSGFSERELARMGRLLEGLHRPTSPFAAEPALPPDVRRHGRFVEPRLVVEVAFAEWTHTSTLRAPRYKGLREDKDPADVVRET